MLILKAVKPVCNNKMPFRYSFLSCTDAHSSENHAQMHVLKIIITPRVLSAKDFQINTAREKI